jgi:hypothetical protein
MTTTDHVPEIKVKKYRFTERDEHLVTVLVAGQTYREAAASTGMSLSTVNRRMRDPGFRRRVEEAHAEAERRVRRQVGNKAVNAVKLLNLVQCDARVAAAPGTGRRVQAARAILQAFTAMQPKRVDVDGNVTAPGAPAVEFVLVGMDPVETLT